MNSQWAVYAKRCTPPTLLIYFERLKMSTYLSHDLAQNESISRDEGYFYSLQNGSFIVEGKK